MRPLFIPVILALCIGCAQPSKKPALGMLKSPDQMTPEEMQKAFERASTPRAEHRALDPLVGSYSVTAKMRMSPDAPEETATGSTEFRWVLGGHFIEQTYNSTFQGQPFVGSSLLGFNNISGKYESTWADSMGTQIMRSEGTADPSLKAVTFTGEYYCPLTNGPRPMKSILTIGKDSHTYEMYDISQAGKEFKSMEITYTRVPKVVAQAKSSRKKK